VRAVVKLRMAARTPCGQPWVGARLKAGNCEQLATYRCDRCGTLVCAAHVREISYLPELHFCPSCVLIELMDKLTAKDRKGRKPWWIRLWLRLWN
jgi:hypothetical protein